MKNCHTSTSANNSSLEVFKITGETGANWIELYLKFNNWSDPSGNLFDEEIQVLESYLWISLKKEFLWSAIKRQKLLTLKKRNVGTALISYLCDTSGKFSASS